VQLHKLHIFNSNFEMSPSQTKADESIDTRDQGQSGWLN